MQKKTNGKIVPPKSNEERLAIGYVQRLLEKGWCIKEIERNWITKDSTEQVLSITFLRKW